MRVKLAGKSMTYRIKGECRYGSEEVLLQKDDNLIADTPWADQGYAVAPFLKPALCQQIQEGILEKVRALLKVIGVSALSGFKLEQYHRFTERPADAHRRFTEKIKDCFPVNQFPIDFQQVTRRISEICGVPLTPLNPATGLEVFCLRVVRPERRDFNPPHRDVWIDRLRNAVNIYVPIAGSNEKSSLPLVEGSHTWKESEIQRTLEGARVEEVAYTVPAVTGARKALTMIRPNPSREEVLVFSPYLIHGGGANLNEDITRVSLEIRFWRKP